MFVCAVDITEHLRVLFNTIYQVYNFLASIEFVAFGYTFNLLGLMFGFVFLVILIKALTFGFDTGIRDELKSMREENKEDKISEYSPKHEYKPRHRSSNRIDKNVAGGEILRRGRNYEKN